MNHTALRLEVLIDKEFLENLELFDDDLIDLVNFSLFPR